MKHLVWLGVAAAVSGATVASAQTPYGAGGASTGGYAPKPASGYGAKTAGGYGEKTSGYGDGGVTVDTPPNARPGQCFARINVPPVIRRASEQVLIEAEHKQSRIIPAVYGWKDKEVVVKEACSEFVTIPATYKTITETVTLRAAYTRKEVIPAVYETKTEQVLVSPATTRWQKGVGLTQAGYRLVGNQTRVTPTGDIMCLVEVPAQYRTITNRVLKTAETVREIEIPAETKVVTRQVIDTQPKVVERKIPAVVRTVKVRAVIEPERVEEITIPAVYKTVEKSEVVTLGKLEWREILCHTNTSREVLARIQVALVKKGYYKGRPTGLFGTDSMAALTRFQKDNNLASGELTIETVRALDVTL